MRRLLLRAHLLGCDPVADFEAAAVIYRRCRTQGITRRGMVDCLIAAVALRTGASLLTCDSDLVRVCGVLGIELDVR
ncbi:PIN domain-containing protein [Occultella glacieicola]|uniref:PIN domain-containing protein n=1 Tax=Occultella glacieicola TaxID=2518684 RepID=UPI0022A81419|nr:PIN domain-containing protein [Occultella glacieicola]